MGKIIRTKEEEADEIIRRLSTPPPGRIRLFDANWSMVKDELDSQHSRDIEKKLAAILAAEIDRQILEELKANYGKGNV